MQPRRATSAAESEAIVLSMAHAIRHRGPDGEGAWTDPQTGIALGHRRLAILDLSPAGAQPMTSASGRYVIVFNGELYNWRSIRRALEQKGRVDWCGHSDTEVLLESIETWGLEGTLRKAEGMFAFALWDRTERRLVLARDRVGEKPLYYGWCSDVFLFGSELKALKAHPAWNAGVDRNAVNSLIQYSYIPAPQSIHEGISKLTAGCYLTLEGSASPGTPPRVECYWSVVDHVIRPGRKEMLPRDPKVALEKLDAVLREVVGEQMVADVPVGAFLSGGIDSSLVVALMREVHQSPVRTFTIGFSEEEFNEAEHARQVARHLGTRHTELILSPSGALDALGSIVRIYDEPHADSSQLPTFLVSRLARGDVTVCLSGDGGDELFAGYNHYEYALRIWRILRAIPHTGRGALQPLFHRMPMFVRLRLAQTLGVTDDRLLKAVSIARAGSLAELYELLSMRWADVPDIVLGASRTPWSTAEAEVGRDSCESLMLQDFVTYLPDSILCKVDRAAMAVSLETRLPLLDRRVIELAWKIPLALKRRDGRQKWILRQLLHRYVPERIVDREKRGFGIPLAAWLRGPLREWAESLLDERRLRDSGLLNVQPVRQRWAEHLSGRRDWANALWNVLMLAQWLEWQEPQKYAALRQQQAASGSH